MEINVFSPGGFGSARQFEGVNFAHALVEALERKVQYVRFYKRHSNNIDTATLQSPILPLERQVNGSNDTAKRNGQKPVQYGNPIVGVWRCRACRYQCFPRHLVEAMARPPFLCPDCGSELCYDEEE